MQDSAPEITAERRMLWVGLLTAAIVVLSGSFACAAPFAALAALAALDIDHRDGLILVGAIWLANQVVGFAFLGYPQELQAYAWGLAMGVAALAAFLGARLLVSRVAPRSAVLATGGALLAAFLVYQAVLYALSFALPGGDGAFSVEVVSRIALIDVLTFAGLLIAHRIAVAAGLARRNLAEVRAGSLAAPQQA